MKRSSEKKHWDRFWQASGDVDEVYGTDGRIVGHLERHLDLAGRTVLEVGAGTGRDADAVAARGARAVALDYSEQSLALMKRTLRHPVHVVCGNALGLPFADESFDVVFHQGLLEHFRNPGEMLDENLRVLKTGGVLLVDVPQRYHYYTLLKHALILVDRWFAGWETEFSARELKGLLETRGMEVFSVYGHNLSPPVWYRASRRLLRRLGIRLPMYPEVPRLLAGPWRALASRVPETVRVNTAMVVGCVAQKRAGG